MIKRRRRKAARLDDSGFSLVELLVAVVILGVIVGPLLHTFVTGAVTSAKSRRLGDANLAAQNISESIESATLATSLTEPKSVFGGNSASLKETYLPNAESYEVDVNGLTSGKSKFDAVVTFSSASASDQTFQTINSQYITDYSSMDAAFAQSGDITDPDEQSYSEYLKNVQDANAAITGIERSIVLNVDYAVGENKVTDKTKIKALLSYKYTYTYSYTKVNTDGTTSPAVNTWAYASENELFPGGFDSTKQPNIYLMYTPWYDTVALGGQAFTHTGGDVIDINNLSNLNFNLFLVKQYTSGAKNSYKASVELIQERSDINSNAKVYSNAKEDMNSLLNTELVNVTFIKKGVVVNTPQKFAGYQAGSENDVVSKTAKNRIYDVTIQIYDAGTKKLVNTFNTTKLQ